MATFVYNEASLKILQGAWDLTSLSAANKLQIMLVNAGYTPNQSHTAIDPGVSNATSPLYNEIVATNYTGGFGGSSRKVVTATFAVDNTGNRSCAALTQPTWLSLGGATNDTVRSAILYVAGTDDPSSIPFVYFDLPGGGGSGILTNGSDFLLQFASLGSYGNLRFND